MAAPLLSDDLLKVVTSAAEMTSNYDAVVLVGEKHDLGLFYPGFVQPCLTAIKQVKDVDASEDMCVCPYEGGILVVWSPTGRLNRYHALISGLILWQKFYFTSNRFSVLQIYLSSLCVFFFV